MRFHSCRTRLIVSTGESRYERRVRALRKQIDELEAENVATREWTMRGEAKSRERPINSLLEEDLDFEQMAKVVPIVTAEATASLEERIKKRILDDNYDDVVRRRPFDPAAYLPSRLLEIAGTQSDKSLAELYEDEYSAERQRAEGQTVAHEVDARLEKDHKEVEKLYDDLCNRLDALSNARFTPKAVRLSLLWLFCSDLTTRTAPDDHHDDQQPARRLARICPTLELDRQYPPRP